MSDDFTQELIELILQAGQEADEERLLTLTKRINELLREQDQQQARRRRNDTAA